MKSCDMLLRSQTRIDLLFTMSEIPQARPVKDHACEVMFSRTTSVATLLELRSIWWSQTGSNRRPHACKARALPAELWPRTRRRMLYAGECKTHLFQETARSIKWWAW